jgi:hypothetical protein
MAVKFELLPLVDMDGILSEDERKRIIARLHSILSWVGSSIPEKEVIRGKQIDLRKIILELISKPKLTKEDIEKAHVLAKGIEERERYLEEIIIHGDISEEKALELLEEARGLLRAMEELRSLEERPVAIEAKVTLLKKIDDEKRWRAFLGKLK